MTDNARLILDCLFGSIWRLFTSWHIPGTHVTPAEFALFILFVCVVFRFLADFSLGIFGGHSTLGRGMHGSVRIPFRKHDDVE